jgi:hypothetical protein
MQKTPKTAAILAAAALLLAAMPPAQAGFLDQLFGSFTRHVFPPAGQRGLPEMSPIPGDRVAPQGGETDWRPRSENGPRVAFCVRTCDGRYFPVHAHAGFSAAQMCKAFCPASETRLYSGGGIDHAVAADGRPYADLPQAFVYRKQLVAGCTCNGKDAFGLASIDVKSDPTLRRGDVVATVNGLMAVSGKSGDNPQFTPASAYRGLSERSRDQLVGTKVATPGRPAAPIETTGAASR